MTGRHRGTAATKREVIMLRISRTACCALTMSLVLPCLALAAEPRQADPRDRHAHPGRSPLEDLGLDVGVRQHRHDEPATAAPQHTGHEILGALQEVIGLLLADPATDWSTVSVERLRDHLVDLDRVLVDAVVEETTIEGGVVARIRGEGDTVEAARRLIPAHVALMDGFRGWRVSTNDAGDGLEVRIVAPAPAEVEVIRALGFFGLMASGVHHPHRLLAVARGRAHAG
jgi:hypothetical protein